MNELMTEVFVKQPLALAGSAKHICTACYAIEL